MMKKKILTLCMAFVLCIVTAFSAGCAETGNLSEENLSQTSYQLSNLSKEFTVEETRLETYYKEGSAVPYVGIEDFLAALNGVFDVSGLVSTSSEEKNEYILRDKRNGHVLFADWENDTLSVNSFHFFSSLISDTSETDYSAHSELLTQWTSSSAAVTFDLGKYGFDILYTDGQALLPFYIANLLFCSTNLYNVYFNGEKYFGLFQSDISTLSTEDRARIRSCDWNNTDASSEMRQTTVNFLEFALDYFYGLKDYKGIDSFGEDIITGELRTRLLSGDAATHNQAYIDLFQKTLNELHTTLISPSFFAASDARFDLSGDNAGTASTAYSALSNELGVSLVNSIGETVELPDGSSGLTIPAVRFEGDTAIILMTGFAVGTNDQIYNDDGTISENARQYDTFYLMQYAMQKIDEYSISSGVTVENVVLDLTINGGGSLAAMISALGFLTDEPIAYTGGNLISGENSIEYYLVNTDGDGDYKDEDAYDMYDWYVLTSPLTFSAANFFTAIVKDMGIATVIGEQSGGGTCAVFTLVLPDGMTTNISGSPVVLQAPAYEQDVIVGGELVEDGITPDIALDRQYFYDNKALVNAIRSAKQP